MIAPFTASDLMLIRGDLMLRREPNVRKPNVRKPNVRKPNVRKPNVRLTVRSRSFSVVLVLGRSRSCVVVPSSFVVVRCRSVVVPLSFRCRSVVVLLSSRCRSCRSFSFVVVRCRSVVVSLSFRCLVCLLCARLLCSSAVPPSRPWLQMGRRSLQAEAAALASEAAATLGEDARTRRRKARAAPQPPAPPVHPSPSWRGAPPSPFQGQTPEDAGGVAGRPAGPVHGRTAVRVSALRGQPRPGAAGGGGGEGGGGGGGGGVGGGEGLHHQRPNRRRHVTPCEVRGGGIPPPFPFVCGGAQAGRTRVRRDPGLDRRPGGDRGVVRCVPRAPGGVPRPDARAGAAVPVGVATGRVQQARGAVHVSHVRGDIRPRRRSQTAAEL